MQRAKIGFLCGLAMMIAASGAFAEGDAAKGGELAREICVRCHHVEAGGPFKLHPPSFAAIAVYRTDVQVYGRIMFPPLHAGMPQLGYRLTPDNVDHIVAYIRSLEER